jgi:hypothetical protein
VRLEWVPVLALGLEPGLVLGQGQGLALGLALVLVLVLVRVLEPGQHSLLPSRHLPMSPP